MTLEELRRKYPLSKHLPLENCNKCGGAGEYWHTSNSDFGPPGHYTPCACIFISHDLLPAFRTTMRAVVERLKSDLDDDF